MLKTEPNFYKSSGNMSFKKTKHSKADSLGFGSFSK